ncbi:MAG: hypothetical protein IPK16_15535 [Anaerolineales bacterium]|nr:hypothetical protein [Anaerolineales bacterium]
MIRKIFFTLTTVVLVLAVFAGIVNATDMREAAVVKANLANVRAVASVANATGASYAIDGGELFAGRPGEWRKVQTPNEVIVGAVALDPAQPGVVYIGAANELVVYRSTDRGQNWLSVPLTEQYVGGVTSLAVDSLNRTLYAGTDTAGVFRLRDVGSSMIAGGQQPLDEPVLQVATDSTGAGLVFVRTAMNLYRGENGGMSWSKVENLLSAPTALAIANRFPATVYVGTADRGVLTSQDGTTWSLANDGLGMMPGNRLYVDALTIDPAQLDVVYAAVSYLYGSTTVHHSPVGVTMSTNGGASWSGLYPNTPAQIVSLIPVPGQTGAAFALTTTSRELLPVGKAPVITEPVVTVAAPASTVPVTSLAAWLIAALAASALLYAVVTDAAQRRQRPAPKALRPQTVHNS